MKKIVSFLVRKKSIEASGFLTLVSGNIIVQILAIAFYPLISRIYSPEEFGDFSSVMVVVVFGAILSTGQLHIKLPTLAKKTLVDSYFKSSILNALIIFVLIISFLGGASLISRELPYGGWLKYVPFLILFSAISDILKSLNLAKKDFRQNVFLNFSQRLTANIAKVFSSGAIGSFGLIVGELVGAITSSCFLIKYKMTEFKFSTTIYKKTVLKEISYQVTQTTSAVINQLSLDVPIIALTIKADSAAVGLYAMASKLIAQPLVLVGNSLAGAVFRKINELLENDDNGYIYVKNILKYIFILLTPVTILTYLGIKPLILILLGDSWEPTAALAQAFSLIMAFKIMSSLVNITLITLGSEKLLLIKKSLLFIGMVAIFGFINLELLDLVYLSVFYEALIVSIFTVTSLSKLNKVKTF